MKLCDNDAYREEFMALVYGLLMSDGTNDRANQIIRAFDMAPAVEAELLLPNDPLTLEELKEMVGEPVYIVTYEKAEWCILHSYHSSEIVGGGFIMTRRTAEKRAFPYADYGKTWLAYRRKPEAATPKANPDWCDHIKRRFEKVN